ARDAMLPALRALPAGERMRLYRLARESAIAVVSQAAAGTLELVHGAVRLDAPVGDLMGAGPELGLFGRIVARLRRPPWPRRAPRGAPSRRSPICLAPTPGSGTAPRRPSRAACSRSARGPATLRPAGSPAPARRCWSSPPATFMSASALASRIVPRSR